MSAPHKCQCDNAPVPEFGVPNYIKMIADLEARVKALEARPYAVVTYYPSAVYPTYPIWPYTTWC